MLDSLKRQVTSKTISLGLISLNQSSMQFLSSIRVYSVSIECWVVVVEWRITLPRALKGIKSRVPCTIIHIYRYRIDETWIIHELYTLRKL